MGCLVDRPAAARGETEAREAATVLEELGLSALWTAGGTGDPSTGSRHCWRPTASASSSASASATSSWSTAGTPGGTHDPWRGCASTWPSSPGTRRLGTGRGARVLAALGSRMFDLARDHAAGAHPYLTSRPPPGPHGPRWPTHSSPRPRSPCWSRRRRERPHAAPRAAPRPIELPCHLAAARLRRGRPRRPRLRPPRRRARPLDDPAPEWRACSVRSSRLARTASESSCSTPGEAGPITPSRSPPGASWRRALSD